MKRYSKYLRGLLLAIVMILCLAAVPNRAEAATSGVWEYKLSGGGVVITKYTGNSADVTIPATMDGVEVIEIGTSAFSKHYEIVSVTFPKTLEKIGHYAFEDCTSLRSLTLPEDLETVGNRAFANCKKLAAITVKSKNLKDFYGNGETFLNAGKDTDGIVVTITDGVTRIPANMFECAGEDYANFKSVSISGSVKEIGSEAFHNCVTLESVKFAADSELTLIGTYAFQNCSALTSINLPKTLLKIRFYAFDNCSELGSLTLPESLEIIEHHAFAGCRNLSTIVVNSKRLQNCNNVADTFQNAGKDTAGIAVKFSSDVTRVPGYMFCCDADTAANIQSVSISSSVKEIGSYAFARCYDLETVTFSSGSELEQLGNDAFEDCTSLSSITLPKKLETIGNYAFSGCTSLENLELPESLKTVGYYAFRNCRKLANVTVKTVRMDSFNSSGNTFQNAGVDTDGIAVTFASGVTRIPSYMFCTSETYPAYVKNVSISSTVKSIGKNAFKYCCELEKVTFAAGSQLETIEDGAFIYCTELEDIVLPEKLETIYSYAFESCTELESITIPASVKEIRYDTFRDCKNLEKITFCGDAPSIGYEAFYNVTAKVYYPAGNSTWTDNVRKDYGGTLTWKATSVKIDAPDVSVDGVASSGKNKLSWDAVSGAAKYKVYRATSKTGSYTRLITTSKLSYTDSSAKAGTKYYYYVVAVDAAGNTSDKSDIEVRTCDLARPVVSVSNVSSSGKIKVSWDAVDGAKEYKVYRATSKSGTYKLVKTTTSTSYTNTSAVAGRAYYYKVKAIHKNDAANSAYSSVKSRTCDLPRPVVSIKLSSKGKPSISWKEIDGADVYKVYRATSANGTYKLMKTTSATSYTNTGAEKGVTYYYRVVAVHSKSAANSAKSTAVSIRSK